MSERLWKILNSEEGDSEWERRVGELRADLEVFVTQDEIDQRYLFLLYPARDAVWEIRSVRTEPSIRVLGSFAQKDTFVAMHHALRSDLGLAIARLETCEAQRQSILASAIPSYNPVVTTDVKDVVTGAIDGRYFKS